ncbi:hypothetical protein, partial [Nocardiopsis gilva]|uniref:hypothetical protein n=1 Tax=Nocardiopsis gilva TaxID=280236 RepID=UPI0039F0831B
MSRARGGMGVSPGHRPGKVAVRGAAETSVGASGAMEIKGETEVLVLHGLWESAAGDGTADGAGSLVLWGEDATLPARTVSRATIRPHPYAAAEARLRAAITSLTGAPDARAASAAEVDLLLPGSPTHPL